MIKVAYASTQTNKEMLIPLHVSMKTTAKQVCKMCLDHIALYEDANCYRVTIARFDKKSKYHFEECWCGLLNSVMRKNFNLFQS